MSVIGKLCRVLCIVYLIPQTVECGNIKDVCGFQRCEKGRTFCHDNRCRSCSDLDGTKYGCQNNSTWRTCFLHCKEKLTQEYEIDKQKYNHSLNKRLEECQQHMQNLNITRSHENAPKEIKFYILITSIAVVGLCIALIIALFLGCKLLRIYLTKRKGNRHVDPEKPLLMFDKPEDEEKFTTMTTSVLTDDTDIKTVGGSETSSEREDSEDPNNPEESISCFTNQRRDLLRGVPPVQESYETQDHSRHQHSRVVVSSSPLDDS